MAYDNDSRDKQQTTHENQAEEYSKNADAYSTNDNALELCNQQMQEWKDKFFRLSADFDNFKRRLEKDQLSLQRAMQSLILLDVVSILDDFERAFSGPSSDSIAENLLGFSLIRKNLNKILEKHGVIPIQETKNFDPHIHEAVMNVAADANTQPGSVVSVLQKGYMFKDHVLRPAKVSVAQ